MKTRKYLSPGDYYSIEWNKFSHITSNAFAYAEEHYILSKWLLTASDYGVPQKRQRAIWVGSKFGEVAPPLESDKKFTVGDAIADLSHISINSQIDTWEWNSDDGFSPTLRAGSGSRTAARLIHYQHARVITVRARLHSYPDWFYCGGTKLDAHKAIGNSVPPLLAHAIASQIWVHLEEQGHLTKKNPTTISFSWTYLLDIQNIDTCDDVLRHNYLSKQQRRKPQHGTSILLARKVIKTNNKRSPPLKIYDSLNSS